MKHHEDEFIKKKKSMVIMAVMALRTRQLPETYPKFTTYNCLLVRLTKGTTELLWMLGPEPRGLQVLETEGGQGAHGSRRPTRDAPAQPQRRLPELQDGAGQDMAVTPTAPLPSWRPLPPRRAAALAPAAGKTHRPLPLPPPPPPRSPTHGAHLPQAHARCAALPGREEEA